MDKKMIIIIAVNTLLLLGLMAGGFMFMAGKMTAMPGGPDKDKTKAVVEDLAEKGAKTIYPLATFIVNLSGEDGRRYLRVTMELEVVGAKAQPELEKCIPRIRDAVLMVLPTRSVEEILSVDGKNALREAILNRINAIISGGTVSNLYFTEFVIQ